MTDKDKQIIATARCYDWGLAKKLADSLEKSLAREEELCKALLPYANGCSRYPMSPRWDLQDPPDPSCCPKCFARVAILASCPNIMKEGNENSSP